MSLSWLLVVTPISFFVLYEKAYFSLCHKINTYKRKSDMSPRATTLYSVYLANANLCRKETLMYKHKPTKWTLFTLLLESNDIIWLHLPVRIHLTNTEAI